MNPAVADKPIIADAIEAQIQLRMEKFRRMSAAIKPQVIDLNKYEPTIITYPKPVQTADKVIITAEQIAEQVPPGLVPMRDARGILYDVSTMAIICDRSHAHRYFLADVNNTLKCRTCSAGTLRTQQIIMSAESVFGAPFIFDNDKYTCKRLKLVIEFGPTTAQMVIGDYTHYKFGPKVRNEYAKKIFGGINGDTIKPVITQELADIYEANGAVIDQKNIIINDLKHLIMLEYC